MPDAVIKHIESQAAKQGITLFKVTFKNGLVFYDSAHTEGVEVNQEASNSNDSNYEPKSSDSEPEEDEKHDEQVEDKIIIKMMMNQKKT